MRPPILLAAIALLLAACAVTPEPPPAPTAAPAPPVPTAARQGEPGEQVTITFGTDEWQRAEFEPLIDRFNAENPDVRVQLVAMEQAIGTSAGPDALNEDMRRLMSTVDTATLFWLSPDFLRRGLVRDLTPFIDADPAFDRDDFYPGGLAAATVDGAVALVPRTVYVPLLAYNRDLWAERGLPPPAPDWTWADVFAAADQLARRDGAVVTTYGMAAWTDVSVLLGELETGERPFDWGPVGQARLDDPAVIVAAERLAERARSGALLLQGGDRPEPRDAIMARQVGIWSPAMLWLRPDETLPFALGTATMPPLAGAQPLYADGFVMSAGTRHPEAAWRWLAFLSREAGVMSGGDLERATRLPARRSVAERVGYWDALDAEARAAVEAALARPASEARPVDGARFDALTPAIEAIVAGEPPSAALAAAQARYLELVSALPAATPTPAPIVVAPPPEVPVAAANAVPLTFFVEWDDGRFRRAVEQFNREHPAIFVTLATQEAIDISQAPTLAELAERGDVFLAYGFMADDDLTATLDIQPLLDADRSFPRDDLPPAVLAHFARDGRLHALPYGLSLQLVVYNADLFAEAGVPVPAADWTIDDFGAAALALAGGEGAGRRYGFDQVNVDTLDLFLQQRGVRPTIGEGEAQRPNFTDPQVQEAVAAFVELARASAPRRQLGSYQRGLRAFDDQERQAGRVGMWFTYGMDPWELGGEGSFRRGVLPPPRGPEGLPTGYSASGLFISARTASPEAAWTFVAWLSGRVEALGGAFPARASLVESAEFLRQSPEGAAAVYDAYRATLWDPAPPRPLVPRAIDLFWFYRAVDRAIQQGDTRLGAELATAQRLTEAFQECVRGGGAPAECALGVDPEYAGYNTPAP